MMVAALISTFPKGKSRIAPALTEKINVWISENHPVDDALDHR